MSLHDIPLSVRALLASGPQGLQGDHLTEFARRLKARMHEGGLRDAQVAELTGLSKQTVNWARRGVLVSRDAGERLAKAVGFEWEDLATPRDRVRFQDDEGRWWLLVRVTEREEAV